MNQKTKRAVAITLVVALVAMPVMSLLISFL